jgi:hypothetical protein
MSHWILCRVILGLALGAYLAGTHYQSAADQHRKPGRHWADDPRFSPSWLEFYTAKGQFYLKLSRWLKLAAFVAGVSWIYLFVYHSYGR